MIEISTLLNTITTAILFYLAIEEQPKSKAVKIVTSITAGATILASLIIIIIKFIRG